MHQEAAGVRTSRLDEYARQALQHARVERLQQLLRGWRSGAQEHGARLQQEPVHLAHRCQVVVDHSGVVQQQRPGDAEGAEHLVV